MSKEADDAEKRAMMCRAAYEGDMCGKCGKPFEPNEPVFREGSRWLDYPRWGGAAPVCAGRVPLPEWFVHVASCVACGRTVRNERRRTLAGRGYFGAAVGST
jgi:hypothetical protein